MKKEDIEAKARLIQEDVTGIASDVLPTTATEADVFREAVRHLSLMLAAASGPTEECDMCGKMAVPHAVTNHD